MLHLLLSFLSNYVESLYNNYRICIITYSHVQCHNINIISPVETGIYRQHSTLAVAALIMFISVSPPGREETERPVHQWLPTVWGSWPVPQPMAKYGGGGRGGVHAALFISCYNHM